MKIKSTRYTVRQQQIVKGNRNGKLIHSTELANIGMRGWKRPLAPWCRKIGIYSGGRCCVRMVYASVMIM